MISFRNTPSIGVSTRLSINNILFRSKPYTTAAQILVKSRKQDLIPPATIKWYYATDIPLSKPSWFAYHKTEEPKKFMPFSEYDSDRIESQFHRYFSRTSDDISPIVEVSEDRLFQVNVRNYSLEPVYWEGPVYEIRRGLWFGSDGIPLGDVITQEIEMGYEVKKPYLFDEERKKRVQQEANRKLSKSELAKFNSDEGIGDEIMNVDADDDDVVRIGGGMAVIYFDNNKAALFPESMINTFQLPIIRNFGASSGALMGVQQIQRGFTRELTSSIFDNFSNNPISSLNDMIPSPASFFSGKLVKKSVNYSEDNDGNDKKQNKEMKKVIEDDFENYTNQQSSKRQVDHLVLCVHGIGQVLGTKYESINFAHNINMMRNTMKAVYKGNDKFRKLAYSPDAKGADVEGNNRVQVLPIAWRHKIGFQPNILPDTERDKDQEEEDEPRLPTLSQINVDGVKSLRNIIGDVALDILLYYESKYFNQILESVTEEINRVYKLFMERNPDFKGQVHLLGHSLGSAISFDILARQYNKLPTNADPKIDLLFDVDTLFCIGCPVGVFKLIGQKNVVHRGDLPDDFDPRNEDLTFSSPKCNNLYNLYHPCDPIGYRLEPLIKPRFSNFKAEEAPFAVEGFNTQLKDFTSFTDELQDRFVNATTWFFKKKRNSKELEGVHDQFIDENALGDIVRSIVKSNNDENTDSGPKLIKKMAQRDLDELTKFNKRGRVDYCLPMGVFDISLISAISAHVSYFEDQDTAGFIMGELLSLNRSKATSKDVTLNN